MAFYVHRANSVAVPLIALDELPHWLHRGQEDWYSPEYQQYISPISEQYTIRVGEYEVFGMWGDAMYQLPMWMLVGVRGDGHGDGTEAGTKWKVEREWERGEIVTYHLDRGARYDYGVDEGMIDNGHVDGWGQSSEFTEGGMSSSSGIAAGGQGGEQITDNGVNREGVLRNISKTPHSSPVRLDSSTYDGSDDEGFSYFDLPLSCQYQQCSLPHQQATMSPTPSAWAYEFSRAWSNNSYSSEGDNSLHSLASNINTETSASSVSSSEIPHAVFHVPILPQVPLGLTQSAPSCFLWDVHHGHFPLWLESTAGGDGSIRSV